MTHREETLKQINHELEKMSDEELDEVAGGTNAEFHELMRAIIKNDGGGFLQSVGLPLSVVNEYLEYSPTAIFGTPVKGAMIKTVGRCLSEVYGIKSDLSTGVLGLGPLSRPNRYEYKGKRISHNDALNIILGK